MYTKISLPSLQNFKVWNIPKKSYSHSAKLTYLKLISKAFRNPNFNRAYLRKHSEQASKIFTACAPRSLLCLCKISRSEASQKISYRESVKLTCLKLISKAFRNSNFHRAYLQKCSKPASKIFTTYTPRSSIYSKFHSLKRPRT